MRGLFYKLKLKMLASPFMVAAFARAATVTAVLATEDGNKDSSVNDVIDDISRHTGVKGDLGTAERIIGDNAMALIESIMGVLGWIALIGVGIFTAVDICYMMIPTLHQTLEELAMKGGTTTEKGHPKPRFISQDAVAAYKEATENGKNILLTYLKKRAVAYVAVAIVIYMLIGGNMAVIVKGVLKLLSGVLGVVETATDSVVTNTPIPTPTDVPTPTP